MSRIFAWCWDERKHSYGKGDVAFANFGLGRPAPSMSALRMPPQPLQLAMSLKALDEEQRPNINICISRGKEIPIG